MNLYVLYLYSDFIARSLILKFLSYHGKIICPFSSECNNLRLAQSLEINKPFLSVE